MKIAAVIFDLNGTILDDEDEYGRAYNKVLEGLGVKSGTVAPHVRGIGVKENWPLLRKKYGIKTNKTDDELATETQQAYLKELSKVSIKPGFDDFAQGLKDSGVRIALGTSNTWEVTAHILQLVGLADFFDAITTSEEVIHNKPDPDIFLLSADKLGAERYECLVIEDALAGVEAAHRAGMKAIAIVEDESRSRELIKADLIVRGFLDITPKVIDQI